MVEVGYGVLIVNAYANQNKQKRTKRIVHQQWIDWLTGKTKLHPLAVVRLRELKRLVRE